MAGNPTFSSPNPQATQLLGFPPNAQSPSPQATQLLGQTPALHASTPPETSLALPAAPVMGQRTVTPPRGSMTPVQGVPQPKNMPRSATPPRGSAITPERGASQPRIPALSSQPRLPAASSQPRMPALSPQASPDAFSDTQLAPQSPKQTPAAPLPPSGGYANAAQVKIPSGPYPNIVPQAPLRPTPPPPAPNIPSAPPPPAPNIGAHELAQLPPDELNARNVTIGNYKLTRLLGQGGMGAVYLGEHVEIGKRAAIKILKPELAKDKESIARFLSEARLITRLRHPSIVDVYDCGIIPNIGRYLIMEYLEGDDLYSHLKKRGALSPAEAAGIGWQILDALEAAHEVGIIHRDLKPPNIYLVRWGRRTLVKLLDFGVAKLLDTSKEEALLTRTGVVVGTPAYMAPEQAAGGKEPDGRLDLYSFGVIMFELVTGRRPFLSNNVNEILVMQQVEPAPLPSAFAPGLPKPFEQLILRCLEKAPVDRPASAKALKEELSAVMQGLPTVPLAIEAKPPSTPGSVPAAPGGGKRPNTPSYKKPGSPEIPEVNTADIAPLLAPDEPIPGVKLAQGLAASSAYGPKGDPQRPDSSKDIREAVSATGTGLSGTAQRLKAAANQPQQRSISNSFKELQALRAQATGEKEGMLARMSAEELDALANNPNRATVAVRSPTVSRNRLKALLLVAIVFGALSFFALIGLSLYWLLGTPTTTTTPPTPQSEPAPSPDPIRQVLLDSVPRRATIRGPNDKVLGKTPYSIIVPTEGIDVQLELEGYIGTMVPIRTQSPAKILIQLKPDISTPEPQSEPTPSPAPEEPKEEKSPKKGKDKRNP